MKHTPIDDDLYAYLIAHGHNGDPVLAELVAATRQRAGDWSIMQIAPEQGTLIEILVRISGSRSAIEIGTFTGYSAICIARGLPADGRLLCCDTSEEWTAIAREYFDKAGVADKIQLKIGPAIETLRALPAEQTFDFAFIDADKESYAAYYEAVLQRLRPNGLLVIDNVLWFGAVIDEKNQSPDTVALRALNDHIASDDRVQAVMLSISDGLTIARKRA